MQCATCGAELSGETDHYRLTFFGGGPDGGDVGDHYCSVACVHRHVLA